MDIKNGMIIMGELVFTCAVIYLLYKEERVVAFEKKTAKKIKSMFAKSRHAREIKRQQKINKKAMYIPLRENNINKKSKAA